MVEKKAVKAPKFKVDFNENRMKFKPEGKEVITNSTSVGKFLKQKLKWNNKNRMS